MDTFQLPIAWREPFDELIADARDPAFSPASISHVQGPRASGKSTLLPINIWRALSRPCARQEDADGPSHGAHLIVYATDRHEAERVNELTRREMESAPADVERLMVCNYSQLLALLRRNSTTSCASSTNTISNVHEWIRWEHPTDWINRQLLPPSVFFIVDIDHLFGADFALAMVLLGSWTRDIARAYPDDVSIRIVTVSAGKRSLELSLLWQDRSTRPGGIKLNKTAFPYVLPQTSGHASSDNDTWVTFSESLHVEVQRHNDDDIVQALVQGFRQRSTEYKVVICTEPWAVLDPLLIRDWGGLGVAKRCFQLHHDWTYQQLADVMCVNAPTHGPDDRPMPIVDFILVPRGLKLNFFFPSDRHVHLIIGGQPRTPRIQESTGLLPYAQYDRFTYQELEQQRAWVAPERFIHHHGAGVRVYVPVDTEQRPAREERRRLIDTDHLGGFICAMTEFNNWSQVDTIHALDAFLEEDSWYEACKSLLIQRIFSDTREGPHPQLTDPFFRNRHLFYAILPQVKYDYRLAVLLVLPSHNWIEVRIKTQLAAMLTIGCARLLDITEAGPVDPDQVYALSSGYAKELTRQGTWWAMLGLFASLLKQSAGSADTVQRIGIVRRGGDRTGFVSANTNDMQEMVALYGRLAATMESYGMRNVSYTMGTEASEALSSASYDTLHKHVLHAFLFGTIAVSRKDTGSVLVTDSTKVDFGGNIARLLDLDSTPLGESTLGLYGVTDLVAVNEARRQEVVDWALIPARVISQWVEENHPGQSISTVLQRTAL